jgi:ADP-ribose pyrophosphatase
MSHEITVWERISTKPLWQGRRPVDQWIFRMPNGDTADYEIKQESVSVCVLALTPDNHVILAKQFRPGPMKVLCELPGGGQEPDETPMDAIKRELLEETGYSGHFVSIGTSLSDAYSTRGRYNFVATDCKKVQEPKNDPNEPIEVIEMSLPEFRTHLRSGELTDIATAYLGLDYLRLL